MARVSCMVLALKCCFLILSSLIREESYVVPFLLVLLVGL